MTKMHTILVFAQNKRGVLERITMVIRKKMYNLEQITASDTEKDGIKRITISFSHTDSSKLAQIITHIKSIIEVVDVRLIDPLESFLREVAIIKIALPKNLADLMALVNIFEGKVIFANLEYIILEVVGSPSKIANFTKLIAKYDILEMGSSGGVAMEK